MLNIDYKLRNYMNAYHVICAMHDFGLYNWKQHSTGWLLNQLHTGNRRYWSKPDDEDGYRRAWAIEDEWFYWAQYLMIIREELGKRPHISNKRERREKARKRA